MVIDVKDNTSILSPYRRSKRAVGEVDIMEAIPEEYMKVVAFLCIDDTTEQGIRHVPKATGFFVNTPLEDSRNIAITYVVTARHCIEKAREYGQIYIRLNRKDGDFIELPTNIDDWYLSDSDDVAAIPFLRSDLPPSIKHTDLDIASFKTSDFVGGSPDYKFIGDTPLGKVEIRPRVGHQVYFLGLFTEHYGETRNLPIARYGHISRMPDWLDSEIDNTRCHIVAYLVEFHSLGGHSGSPVFFLYPEILIEQVHLQLIDKKQLDIPADVNLGWVTGFMGLISGHYDIEQQARKTGDILGEIQYKLNSGIAIVTPAEAVMNLLMREDMVGYREKLRKDIESRKKMPTLDISDGGHKFTKEDFEYNLRRVSRKIKPSESDKESSKR